MPKLWIATLAVIFASLLAAAARAAAVPGTVLPPPEFDHTPTIPFEEFVPDVPQVTAACWAQGLDQQHLWAGCATRAKGTCTIFRIDNARVRRHEYGHCNGWPPDHSILKPPPVAVVPKPAVAIAPQPPVVTVPQPPPSPKPWPTDPPTTPTGNAVGPPLFGITRALPRNLSIW
jgi:hypothetical protein